VYGNETELQLGTLSWSIINYWGKRSLYLSDSENPLINEIRSEYFEYYEIDPAWRVDAHFEPATEAQPDSTPTTKGGLVTYQSPGRLTFQIGNTTHSMVLIGPWFGNYWTIFGDKTNGKGTYPGGRILLIDKETADGATTIDFNKAHNPPCAFNSGYACPLPPSENQLPMEVTAGEKMYLKKET
jgi:uncharacterized protein (DUF1684 family)